MKNKITACAFALLLALALPLSSHALTVTPEKVNVYAGETVQLKADQTSGVTWKSLHEHIATVQDGLVKGKNVSKGVATIRATHTTGAYQVTKDVTVYVYSHAIRIKHTEMTVGEWMPVCCLNCTTTYPPVIAFCL